MAFITYRVSTTPTLATANVAKGLQLTNSEIDANFKALDDGKLEKNGSAASLTGLPLTTGVTGILPVANGGTGSSTASTGSGGVVLATSPTLVTPNLGTPSFLDLTNARNLPLDGTIAVSGKLPIAFGGTNSTATPTAGTIPYGTGTAYAFTAAGTTGQVLTSAGAGTPTWATITTSAGGSNTQLQYNSSGSFAGSANMTFNGTTLALNSLSVSALSTLSGGVTISATNAAPAATGSTRSDFQRVVDAAGSRSVDTGTSNTGAWIQSRDKNDYSVNYPLLLNPNGGNVAVGTTLGVTGVSTLTGGAVIQGLTVGLGAGAVTTNTAVGVSVLQANTTGSGNTAIGYQALYSNTGGIGNIASGRQALYSTTTGNNNTASGYQTLYSNLTGSNNIAIGASALYSNTAWNNIAIGTGAGTNLTTGANNVIIGSIAGTAGLVSTVIIGAGSTERLRIDSAGKMITLGQVETPDVTSLLTTANTYPTTRPSLNLDFANSATLDPRITFTRGTNATYTGSDRLVKTTAGINSPRFDWDPVTRECKGLLIEEARTNLLTYSSNFDRAWTTYGTVMIVPNSGISPDGSLSATTISMSSGAGIFQSVSSAASTVYTISCWIRSDTTQTVQFLSNTNLSEVTPTTITVTTSWQRITLVKPTTTGTIVNLQFDTSSTSAPFQIWGAQIELGAFATSYIPSSVTWTGRASTASYIGSNGLIQTAASGTARYQYNPTNLSVAPFLLLEPAATNLVTYSDDTSAYGFIDNSSIVVNQIAAPDGNTTADKIVSTLTGGSNNCYIQKTVAVVADTQTYTFSVFVKAGTSPTTTLNLQLANGTYQQVVGIITWATNTISTGTLVNYGNGWFKASVTLTNNGTNTVISPRIYVRDQSTANVSGEYAYVWGWQVETGSVATSYIPTAASTVTRIADTSTSAQTTRSADVATMTNSNFSSWYNQTEGTLFAKATYAKLPSSYPVAVALSTNNIWGNKIELSSNMYANNRFGLSTLGIGQTDESAGSITAGVMSNWCIAYATNNIAGVAGGATPVLDTTAIIPTGLNTLSIGCIDGRYWNGWIAKLAYYPTRLSNSTLQALTT